MGQPQEKSRIEFKSKVRATLFNRAGGKCSVPRCKNPTVGPFEDNEGAVNLGVACHIYSAAEDGPRGRGGKSDEFIGSDANGLWCCPSHASLIDKQKGKDYPANVLFAWKALAEARIRKQITDAPSPLGWVDSIEFVEFDGIRTPPKVSLSRNTLFFGPNCSGKTSLMEAAASVSDSRHGERFSGRIYHGRPAKYKALIKYSTVDTLSKTIEIQICGENLVRQEGATPCLLPPGDLEIIFCSERETRYKPHEDHVDFLMRYLNIDKSALFALTKVGGGNLLPGEIVFTQAIDIEYDDDDEEIEKKRYKIDDSPFMELRFKQAHGEYWVGLDNLSTSEHARLLLDLAITKAKETCKQKLTLLLIDGLLFNLDQRNFEVILNVLTESDFQTALSLPPYREADVLDRGAGEVSLKKFAYLEAWRLAILKRSEP
ncbi:MAG: hypothetical protein KKC24_11450 [Gammaproteobacteria bacterium]|uniref:AAA domain-containing protein n=1 Tax=Pseudomonas mandelii TaxID=75612 RepID=A0ABY0W1R1_9PSED|nr:hypothetical protein [Pseudomonas mandelii]MBU0522379.1 hypothetical protein [Gammaproteobacteria bacterium]MDF9881445.1 hypothetical protein [Pseudomonas silensiensis]MBU0819456.1 hypothetical protein [Gammaproteobacteria bacterium]MBU0843386.1 hypothetical protein [Gammaproteobacteria bacterium]MBU1838623.1 hypothetical protein [Gammaproteobacteria bacterium]